MTTVDIVALGALATVVDSLTHDYRRIAPWAVVVAVAGNLTGLWFRYKLDIPVGTATIFVLAVTLIVVKLLPLLRTKNAVR